MPGGKKETAHFTRFFLSLLVMQRDRISYSRTEGGTKFGSSPVLFIDRVQRVSSVELLNL
jgi:hypothetical protein